MKNYIILFISNVLIDNFALIQCLGLCSFIGMSKKVITAFSMGMATTFVITLTSVFTWLINNFILLPLKVTYLRTLAFLLIITVIVQFTEYMIRKINPLIYRSLGIFLPLITSNCTILVIISLNINQKHDLLQSTLYGFSAAIGLLLVMVLFATIHERLVAANIPKPFQGFPIDLITAGLMSLAFMGFDGLLKV